MDYKYSIVMPAYNIEKYVAVMIESIIHQTYENWELIIIDDGSTDKSGEICDRYLSDKVSVYHIQNKGQIGARIEGIRKCTGDYTLVVDSDDYLEPDCLMEVNKVLITKMYDCVVFPFDCCDEELNYESTTIAPSHMGELSQQEIIKWIIDTMNHGLVNKIIRTEVIKSGIEEAMTDKVAINGDYALIIPIMCYVKSAYYIDKSFYKYRVFDNSISHKRKYQHVIDTDRVTTSVVSILREHNIFYGDIETSVLKSYFVMIPWLMREVCMGRFVTKEELAELHNSKFFNECKRYETRSFVGVIGMIEMHVIRGEGRFALLRMNLVLKMLNHAYFIKKGFGILKRKLVSKN